MQIKIKLILVFLIATTANIYGQEPCATTKEQELLFANDSMAKKAYLESERILLEKTLEKQRLQQVKPKLVIRKKKSRKKS